MFVNILLFIWYTWNYKYANYGPRVDTQPVVYDITGKLSSSSEQTNVSPARDACAERTPLFPSREAKLEARRRSYGSSGSFNVDAIFPTRAARVEARRRSYGTSLTLDDDAADELTSQQLSVSSPSEPRRKTSRGLYRDPLRVSEEHETDDDDREHSELEEESSSKEENNSKEDRHSSKGEIVLSQSEGFHEEGSHVGSDFSDVKFVH